MSTNKPRLTLTLDPELADAVERLARVQGCPKSRVLTELLQEAGPVLRKVADTLELAMKVQKGAREGLRRAVDETEAELRPMLSAVISAYDGLGQQIGEIADQLEAAAGAQVREPQPLAAAAEQGTGAGARVRKNPRAVNTGVTDQTERAASKGKSRSIPGCLCTETKHERQENRACPVHSPVGVQ